MKVLKSEGAQERDTQVFSPDGNTLLLFGGTNALRFIDIRTGQPIGTVGHSSPLLSNQFTSTGKLIVTHGADGSVNRWDAATATALGPIAMLKNTAKPKQIISPLTTFISPDGQILVGTRASPGATADLMLADSATGKELVVISLSSFKGFAKAFGGFGPVSVVFSPGNKLLAVEEPLSTPIASKLNDGQKIHIYDVTSGKRLHTLTNPVPSKKIKLASLAIPAPALIFSPDGRTLARPVGEYVFLWNTVTGERAGSLMAPNGTLIDHVAFSPDGRAITVESNDGTATMFELATNNPRRVFGQPVAAPPQTALLRARLLSLQGEIQAQRGSRLAASPDAKMLALGGKEDRTVHIWDIATGTELATFKGHTGNINAIAFSPDSTRLASASADTTALIWDLTKLERPAPAAKTLTPAELDLCWQALLSKDAAQAFTAIRDLAAAPKQAVALIKEKVQPAAAVEQKRIDELISQIDDAQYKVREKATNELYKIGEPIIPSLDTALTGNLTLETKRRLEEIRGRLTGKLLQGERLRAYRAVEVLERIGTPEARQVLQALANGAPGVLLTTSAKEALDR
jgi:WD40 repeat protein